MRHIDTPVNDGVFEQHRLELRCGCLTMAALGQLRTEQYGYALRHKLASLGLAILGTVLVTEMRNRLTSTFVAMGYSFVAVAADMGMMMRQATAFIQAIQPSLARGFDSSVY